MQGVIIVTGIAFVSGVLLIVIHTLLNRTSHKLEEIMNLLPQYNCGACGYGSCEGYAREIVKGKIKENTCKSIDKEKLELLKKHFK